MSLFYHAKDRKTFSSKDFIVQQFLILRSLPPATHTHGSKKKKTRAIFENFPADRVAFNVDKGRRWQNGYLNFGPLSVEYWARWGGKKRKSNNVVISYLSTNSSCWELEHPQTSGQLFIFNPRRCHKREHVCTCDVSLYDRKFEIWFPCLEEWFSFQFRLSAGELVANYVHKWQLSDFFRSTHCNPS